MHGAASWQVQYSRHLDKTVAETKVKQFFFASSIHFFVMRAVCREISTCVRVTLPFVSVARWFPLWHGGHFDIGRATFPLVRACWIPFVVAHSSSWHRPRLWSGCVGLIWILFAQQYCRFACVRTPCWWRSAHFDIVRATIPSLWGG